MLRLQVLDLERFAPADAATAVQLRLWLAGWSPNRPPMYARRFLGCVFVLTLLAVAAAFAFFEWGDQLLIRQAVPQGHFEAANAGGAPDYSKPSNWVARPGTPDDP